ncbi:Hypothetical_protein [Hexamita inflata]|uniref:Hypothetical_protein n=1 Tax=Hexamita inflata TaxID=28002 RepID=A0AA86UUP9_9EUKA|nr:Hypothetical protein HINF_LOCUS53207 [Hexamita inflata]
MIYTCSSQDTLFNDSKSCERHCYIFCKQDSLNNYCCPAGSYYSSNTGPWWISIIAIALFIATIITWQIIVKQKRIAQIEGLNTIIINNTESTQPITVQYQQLNSYDHSEPLIIK